MAPFDFDPKEADTEGGDYPAHEPGRYVFKVNTASETVFKSGNRGIKLALLVDNGKRDVKAFDNLVDTPKARWRWKMICKCLGVAFVSPFDPAVLENKIGVADFKVEDGYLRVDGYCEPGEEGVAELLGDRTPTTSGGMSKAAGGGYDYGPPPADEDEIPF
jgi:hypothetical protein